MLLFSLRTQYRPSLSLFGQSEDPTNIQGLMDLGKDGDGTQVGSGESKQPNKRQRTS